MARFVDRATVAIVAATALFALAAPASAQVINPLDPLQGYCSVGCIDNGTNSPTTQNPPTNFGFVVDPGPATGDFLLDILVPNNENSGVKPFIISGTQTGTATLFSATAWTSGDLDAYLGLSASPTQPIGAYLPSTQALDPGATGFDVYQVDLGSLTLQKASNPNVNPLWDTGGVPIGGYIVGFLNEGGGNIVATANSGAIFETKPVPGGGGGGGGGGTVPEPSSLLVMAVGLLGLGFVMRRRTRS